MIKIMTGDGAPARGGEGESQREGQEGRERDERGTREGRERDERGAREPCDAVAGGGWLGSAAQHGIGEAKIKKGLLPLSGSGDISNIYMVIRDWHIPTHGEG
jgi:hypothetical protein